MTEAKVSYGIQETVEAVKLIMSISKGVSLSLKDDGKFTIGDMQHFTSVIFLLSPAFSGIEKIPSELGDLDSAEFVQLQQAITTQLPELGEKWEEIVTNSLMAVWHIYAVIKALNMGKV